MSWDKLAPLITDTCVATFKSDLKATYAPKNEAPFSLKGIFDRKSYEVDPNSGVKIMSAQPRFGASLADMPANPGPGDTLTFDGITYDVAEFELDGIGGVTLILSRIN